MEQRSQTVELTIRRNGADWQAVSCLPAPLDKTALTALARQALLDYGAQEVDGVLRCRYANLLYHDGWANFAELATEDCWAWYHDLLQATLSTEEFQARYTSPNDFPGWFFPEEELESAVLRHFEIQPGYSAEQLHQDPRYYDAEYRGYQFPGGDGGGGFQPEVCIGTVTQEGDRVMVHTWLDYGGGQTGTEMVLTLRLTGLDPAYRFVSWLPENAVTSAGEAEDWLTEAMQLVQIEPSATGRFTDHGLGCPLLTAEPPGTTPASWSPTPCWTGICAWGCPPPPGTTVWRPGSPPPTLRGRWSSISPRRTRPSSESRPTSMTRTPGSTMLRS